MTITIKIGKCSVEELHGILMEIANIRKIIKKDHPDIVINIEAEIK